MEFTITVGTDGREYARFSDEPSLEAYCLHHNINPTTYCVDGYMNGILLDDVVTE